MISLGTACAGRPHDPAGSRRLDLAAGRNVPRGSVKVMGGTLFSSPASSKTISKKWPAACRQSNYQAMKIELKQFNSRSGRRNTACAS